MKLDRIITPLVVSTHTLRGFLLQYTYFFFFFYQTDLYSIRTISHLSTSLDFPLNYCTHNYEIFGKGLCSQTKNLEKLMYFGVIIPISI